MSISFAEEDDNDDLMNTTARLMLGLVKEPLMVLLFFSCMTIFIIVFDRSQNMFAVHERVMYIEYTQM